MLATLGDDTYETVISNVDPAALDAENAGCT